MLEMKRGSSRGVEKSFRVGIKCRDAYAPDLVTMTYLATGSLELVTDVVQAIHVSAQDRAASTVARLLRDGVEFTEMSHDAIDSDSVRQTLRRSYKRGKGPSASVKANKVAGGCDREPKEDVRVARRVRPTIRPITTAKTTVIPTARRIGVLYLPAEARSTRDNVAQGQNRSQKFPREKACPMPDCVKWQSTERAPKRAKIV